MNVEILIRLNCTACCRRHYESDKEEVDNVEDADPPNDLLTRFRDFFSWVVSFGSSHICQFCVTKCKACDDKGGAETVKAILERAWVLPGK